MLPTPMHRPPGWELPCIWLVSRGHPEAVALLLEFHARVDIRGKDGMTRLQQAENIKNSVIVTLIKQHLSEVWR
jgi:ankyrin repeat protein